RPGELLHLDIKKLARFDGVGHRITGDRRGRSTGMGYDCLHVAIDDATRLAYVEVLPDEKRQLTTGFLVRALRWFRARGVSVERVMTDNSSGYVARLFRKALRMLGLRHIRTRPYTPKTNGKAERFIKTVLREWAYAIPLKSSDTRVADLTLALQNRKTSTPFHHRLIEKDCMACHEDHEGSRLYHNAMRLFSRSFKALCSRGLQRMPSEFLLGRMIP
ncbi:MAG: transposase, partial [Hyphomicrobiales bacterium]